MQEVKITFANIQSHELTQFSLKPGMNFILADDNNVGKSTIFKMLSTMAAYPQVSGYKVNSLIRKDCDKGYAAFSFSGNRVICWLVRGNTAGSAKLFFEHIDECGQSTRSSMCPSDLLDALGIQLSKNGDVINFNDADSVQLISKSTVEGDEIVTQVMTDSRVSLIKSNMMQLARELQSDDKEISGRLEVAENILETMHYTPGVDRFDEALPELSSMCAVLDYCLLDVKLFPCDVDDSEVKQVTTMVNLCGVVEPLINLPAPVNIEDSTQSLMAALHALEEAKVAQLDAGVIDIEEQLKGYQKFFRTLRVINTAHSYGSQLSTSLSKLHRLEEEKLKLLEDINKHASIVECPVKGKVYYTDEKCVPITD